jgi:hypothetical protein
MFKTTKNSSAPIRKLCKVCQDAGKSENEFLSHFTRETRDPNSRVVCPTLLNQECRFCYKKGHTVKYCKALKEKERAQEPRKLNTVLKKEQKKVANPFECLYEDEDVNIKPVSKPSSKEEFPALTVARLQVHNQPVTNSYAAALAKPVSKPISNPVIAPEPNLLSNYVKTKTNLNWAICDSDSEDDEIQVQSANSYSLERKYNDAW